MEQNDLQGLTDEEIRQAATRMVEEHYFATEQDAEAALRAEMSASVQGKTTGKLDHITY